MRVLVQLLDEEDLFIVLAAAGLATQFGGAGDDQHGVNLQLSPSKGMTLPFISYGGSSMIALCVGVGLAAGASPGAIRISCATASIANAGR